MNFGMRLGGDIWNNSSQWVHPDFAYFTNDGHSKWQLRNGSGLQ